MVKGWRVGGVVLAGVAVGLVSSSAVGLAGAGDRARGPARPAAVSRAAVAEVSRECTSAARQVRAGTADGFMRWIDHECRTEGARKLAASARDDAAPMGALICRYAKARVRRGTASATDREQARLCNEKAAPAVSGITTQWNPPPDGPAITVTNAWVGTVGGRRETVYAGSQAGTPEVGSPANPQQGEVVVLAPPATRGRAYRSSGLDGALAIDSAGGTTLTLSAANGVPYRFDLATDTLTKAG
jgi:hypothetical protein